MPAFPPSRFILRFLICLFCCGNLLSIVTCASAENSLGYQIVKPLDYQVVKTRPYPTQTFTQGLVSDQHHLYISSGLYGKSSVIKWDKQTSQKVFENKLPKRIFAEGLTLWQDTLFLLSWKSGKAWQLDRDTFKVRKTYPLKGEGWGITHNNTHLITSSGSAQLQFRSPETFAIERTLTVTDAGKPIKNINELEYAEGYIWANIWLQTRLIKIDPLTGQVIAQVELGTLIKDLHQPRKGNVLNGIAWDEQQQAFWITGKRWPTTFLIQLSP
jgi:glutaminyl-peptide cyclotransferase